MLTPFGKEIRKIRIDHDMRLSEMATKIDVSPTFLTAVENGRKEVPKNFPQRISLALGGGKVMLAALQHAAELSRSVHKVKTGQGSNDRDREVAALFARQFADMPDTKKDKIMNILKDDEEGMENE